MILDALTRICNAQAFNADAVSLFSYDLGNVTPKIDPGEGEALSVGIAVGVAADHTTGDESYEFDLIQSATEDLGTPDVLMTMPLVYTQLTAGVVRKFPIPGGLVTKRFLGIQHNGTGTTPTVTITAWIGPTKMISSMPQLYYAKGFTIA